MNVAELLREGKLSRLLKITVLGTSGSGKTSFLKSLFGGQFIVSDVKRMDYLENKANLTYTPIDVEESTTTLSLNQLGAMVIFTKSNRFEMMEINAGVDSLLSRDDIDMFMTFSIFDTAGQERFEFMADICLKGSDAAILVADGSNISSIEYLSVYIEKIREEEFRTGKEIPVIVFMNKSDLAERGLYLGADFARIATSNEFDIFETSTKEPESFHIPLRVLIEKIKHL
ncbi:MAG: GTP-binding protein [Candidatus Heimdallarchaeota archaeon]|nr:GTP-binding protein [Candidatus Heimdallarchaeota archaeon]MCG3254098.1 GTP-binding protein [Candidatus Heimdallarchaeota archaeon]MCK4291228.1 GTP-binding protein [Candidatus Heimdallarchaeota archaeon]